MLQEASKESIDKIPTSEMIEDIDTILKAGRTFNDKTCTESSSKYVDAIDYIAQKYSPARMYELGYDTPDAPKQIDSSNK